MSDGLVVKPGRLGRRQLLVVLITVATGLMSVMLMTSTAARAAGTNVIQNGDFTAPVSGPTMYPNIPDWPETTVRADPAGCGPSTNPGCNGPFVTVATSSPCDTAQTGIPFLSEDVPEDSDGSDAYVQQPINVPQSPGDLTFTTWGNLDPATATISVVTADHMVHQLLQFTPPPLQSAPSTCSGLSPIVESINMSAYAGQTVGLRIEGANGNASQEYDGTYANFDDFSLQGGSTTTPPPSKRASATRVVCNLDSTTGNFDCDGIVGDASGQQPTKTPTGQLTFTATSGGFGGFPSCLLKPTSPVGTQSGPSADCHVTYFPPPGGLPQGAKVPVADSYSGDSVFATSTGVDDTINDFLSDQVESVVGGDDAVDVGLTCPAGGDACSDTVDASVTEQVVGSDVVAVSASKAKKHPKRRTRKVIVGRESVKLAAGRKRTVRLTLNPAGRKLLAKHRRLAVSVEVIEDHRTIKTKTVHVSAPPKKPKKPKKHKK